MPAVDITSIDPYVECTKEFFQNPYPFYERIREKGDIVWSSAAEPRWMVVSYDACTKIFNDLRFSVEVPESQLELIKDVRHNVAYSDLLTGLTKFMLAQDPPRHTRVRKLANKAFTHAEIGAMSAKIEKIIDSLIDDVASNGSMELIKDFAFPLPITVICEFLGLPQTDHQLLRDWSESIAAATEPIISKEVLDGSAKSARELFDYLRKLIEEKKKKPDDGLLSAFIQAEEEGDRLTLDELLANMLLLIVAGHETTVNLISSTMLCLIRHPQAMKKLNENPAMIPMVLEEVLRYESPIQATDRYVTEDMVFEGHELTREQRLSLIIGGANRDPKHFESPNVFNIERQPKHLAFGQAIHFCLGSPLARFEGKLAFGKLLGKLKNFELAIDEPEYRPSASFRSLASLPLKFELK